MFPSLQCCELGTLTVSILQIRELRHTQFNNIPKGDKCYFIVTSKRCLPRKFSEKSNLYNCSLVSRCVGT